MDSSEKLWISSIKKLQCFLTLKEATKERELKRFSSMKDSKETTYPFRRRTLRLATSERKFLRKSNRTTTSLTSTLKALLRRKED